MASERPRLRVALAGDTMLGRNMAQAIARTRRAPIAPEVVDVAAEADVFIVNLECCISDRGLPWADPRKPFFFRGPPLAAELLAGIGVDCVTLANNHALDYGPQALLDTFEHLSAAGIAWVGAGADAARAGAPPARRARHADSRAGRVRSPRGVRRRTGSPRHRVCRPASRRERRLARPRRARRTA
jgi:poly-gamma-glutamate synthesis protein (capsule biosynthesis protein)